MGTLKSRNSYLVWAIICYAIAAASVFGTTLVIKRSVPPLAHGMFFVLGGSYFLYWYINFGKK